VRLSCGLFPSTAGSEVLTDSTLRDAAGEFVLVVEAACVAGGLARNIALAVELRRGEQPRDRHVRRIALTPGRPWRGAFRVIRGRGGRYSNRLVCRILIDETEAARLTLLDADLEVDAQGRIDEPTDRPPSAATMVLFRERLHNLVCRKTRDVGRR
jgi:hypothetical protein